MSQASSDNESNDENAIIKKYIIELTIKRGLHKTICPSEVARKLYPKNVWRSKMDLVRQNAFNLVNNNKIVIKQKGNIIDISKPFKGPIRLALKS